MAKNSPGNAGHVVLTPGQGTKIPLAVGQLSPLATTRELWTTSAKNQTQVHSICQTRHCYLSESHLQFSFEGLKNSNVTLEHKRLLKYYT